MERVARVLVKVDDVWWGDLWPEDQADTMHEIETDDLKSPPSMSPVQWEFIEWEPEESL